MTKIRRTAVCVIGALLVSGACGVAAAQETVTHPITGREVPKPQFDREKDTLKDQVHTAISAADSNIDALKKMESTHKDAAQKRDKDMEKSLSDLRDGLKTDLDHIDKATATDFASVRTDVESHLKKAESELKTVASYTHVAPSTGAANKQPQSK